MQGWYPTLGNGHRLLMLAFWVALIALLVWVIRGSLTPGEHGRDDSREILDRRLANGEIDPLAHEAHPGKAWRS